MSRHLICRWLRIKEDSKRYCCKQMTMMRWWLCCSTCPKTDITRLWSIKDSTGYMSISTVLTSRYTEMSWRRSGKEILILWYTLIQTWTMSWRIWRNLLVCWFMHRMRKLVRILFRIRIFCTLLCLRSSTLRNRIKAMLIRSFWLGKGKSFSILWFNYLSILKLIISLHRFLILIHVLVLFPTGKISGLNLSALTTAHCLSFHILIQLQIFANR